MNSTMVTTTLALPGYVVAKLMCEQAEQLGANAIIGMHYDATEVTGA